MQTIVVTPAAGKRLIAKATAAHPAVRSALESGTVVIVAGTTNGYVAEEVFASLGRSDAFSRDGFFRGVTTPPSMPATDTSRLRNGAPFPGDVVLVNGAWVEGKTLFDLADHLKEGDVILKGANAVDPAARRAAVLIGDPHGGTLTAAIRAAVGRRVRLIHPVGLEKRVSGDLDAAAAALNAPGARGPRLLPSPGDILTELDAIAMLTGVTARLVAGGGVLGAEGCVWLALAGAPDREAAARALLDPILREPAFSCNFARPTP